MNIKEPLTNSKKLNIIAIADNSQLGEASFLHGIQLARAFKASLIVCTNFDLYIENKQKKSLITAFSYDSTLFSDVETTFISDYFFPETLFNFAERNNTAIIVLGVDNYEKKAKITPKKAIKFIKESRFPIMVVANKPKNDNHYNEVLLSLDMERQNKEKALWAGYFNRFNNSIVHILTPEYKDEGLAKLVKDNVDFVEKLYANLDIKYKLTSHKSSSYFDKSALEYAKNHNIGTSIIMMTKYYTLADIITGPRERKIIGKSDIPLLCINQRDDLYVLCT